MPVAANLTHFAINADDVEGARRFYESVEDPAGNLAGAIRYDPPAG